MPLSGSHARELEARAQLYKTLGDVLSQPGFKAALDELTDDEDAVDRGRRNPRAYLREKGVRLPAATDVELLSSSPAFGLWVCAEAFDTICCAGYSSVRGWFAKCYDVSTAEGGAT